MAREVCPWKRAKGIGMRASVEIRPVQWFVKNACAAYWETPRCKGRTHRGSNHAIGLPRGAPHHGGGTAIRKGSGHSEDPADQVKGEGRRAAASKGESVTTAEMNQGKAAAWYRAALHGPPITQIAPSHSIRSCDTAPETVRGSEGNAARIRWAQDIATS